MVVKAALSGAESLQKQIDNLSTQVTQGFTRLEALLMNFDERVRSVENTQAGCQPVLTSRLDAAWRKIDEHEDAIDKIREIMRDLAQTNRILKWILGIFTAVLLAAIVEVVRGNLTLIKP